MNEAVEQNLQIQKRQLQAEFKAEEMKLRESRNFWRRSALAEAAVLATAVFIHMKLQ